MILAVPVAVIIVGILGIIASGHAMLLLQSLGLAFCALAVLLLIRWAFLPASRMPRYRVRMMRFRIRLRLHPGRGHATVLELWGHWGRYRAWRKSWQTRPTLGFLARLNPANHAVKVGTAHFMHKLWAPVEELILILSPPRTFKTAFLARTVLHYRGPVVATTTKPDVFALTSGVRARRGPVAVFNPEGIGGVPSTFRWNPIDGCDAPAVAIRRADGFANAVSTEGVEDASFWTDKGSSYMRGMFHAAALAGADMRLVAKWAFGEVTGAQDTLAAFGADQWALELGELHSEAQRTAATIRMILSRALGFLADPQLAQSVLPGEPFDIPGFLAASGTLYMVARSDRDNSPLAPLFAMMAGEIHYTATQIASLSAGGRLDPPLLMALDEIVQTCPVPLPKWAADSGGRGIQIISVAHGEAQLESRWKPHGKQTILDTAGVLILLPGIKDTKTLEMASKLCGQASYRMRGQDADSWHDVMTADMIRRIPMKHGLVIRSSCAPVIARLPIAWRDRTYRRAKRNGEHIATLTAAADVPAISLGADVAAAPVTAKNDLRGIENSQAPATPFGGEALVPAATAYPWEKR